MSDNPGPASNAAVESIPTPETATPDRPPRPADPTKIVKHPVTGDLLTAEEVASLKAWALQKGKSMGMSDTDELGSVTEYVFAGAIAFEDTIQMKHLLQLPRIRPLRLRRAVNVNRQQNAQACIAYLCGTQRAKACKPCSRGSGPFTECITVEGALLGACASCHYGGEGNRCDFHISKAQKEKGSRQTITVQDSDDEPYPLDSLVITPKKRGGRLDFSAPSATQSPRKARKIPSYLIDTQDTEESEVPRPSPKKQKTKATEPKAKPAPTEKTTLRKTLGISKEEARKLAKHHMNMATKLMEDSDEE